jgi:hypothetical protein
MGTKSNVNPDHYKEDGRERPGQEIEQERNKQRFARAEAEQRRLKRKGGSDFVPGQASEPLTDRDKMDRGE